MLCNVFSPTIWCDLSVPVTYLGWEGWVDLCLRRQVVKNSLFSKYYRRQSFCESMQGGHERQASCVGNHCWLLHLLSFSVPVLYRKKEKVRWHLCKECPSCHLPFQENMCVCCGCCHEFLSGFSLRIWVIPGFSALAHHCYDANIIINLPLGRISADFRPPVSTMFHFLYIVWDWVCSFPSIIPMSFFAFSKTHLELLGCFFGFFQILSSSEHHPPKEKK